MSISNRRLSRIFRIGFTLAAVFIGLIFNLAVPSSAWAADEEEKGWKLVWSDEFDRDGLPDPSKWNYEEGLVRNREKQYYTKGRSENARVEQGHLIIEARKESYQGADYTSASLITRGKASWTYGRVEVRAKLPTGRGTWPAIWMLASDRRYGGWPACGEIDIMEYVGYNPETVHANVHTRKYNHVKGNNKGAKIQVTRPWENFHTYAVEWFPDHMDFFLDDQKYFSYANENTGPDAWPFNLPEYLILNIAIGGSWGGKEGIDDSIFPQQLQIDYVRVYQQK